MLKHSYCLCLLDTSVNTYMCTEQNTLGGNDEVEYFQLLMSRHVWMSELPLSRVSLCCTIHFLIHKSYIPLIYLYYFSGHSWMSQYRTSWHIWATIFIYMLQITDWKMSHHFLKTWNKNNHHFSDALSLNINGSFSEGSKLLPKTST